MVVAVQAAPAGVRVRAAERLVSGAMQGGVCRLPLPTVALRPGDVSASARVVAIDVRGCRERVRETHVRAVSARRSPHSATILVWYEDGHGRRQTSVMVSASWEIRHGCVAWLPHAAYRHAASGWRIRDRRTTISGGCRVRAIRGGATFTRSTRCGTQTSHFGNVGLTIRARGKASHSTGDRYAIGGCSPLYPGVQLTR
jgi:hypothetical protein